MSLLQVKINTDLKTAIQAKAKQYNVPASSLVKIVLSKAFLETQQEETQAGNIFNAKRDNNGKGVPLDELMSSL